MNLDLSTTNILNVLGNNCQNKLLPTCYNFKCRYYDHRVHLCVFLETVFLCTGAQSSLSIFTQKYLSKCKDTVVQYKVIKWQLYVTPKKFPDKGVFPFENGVKKWLFPLLSIL